MNPDPSACGSGPADILSDLLADTWWFGLTQRMTETAFLKLAELRTAQGFSAIQLVVGIPPEIGPQNEHARSIVGFPWTLAGDINDRYLALAKRRIQRLNKLDLRVIVYGAWGYQMAWLGSERMAYWWGQLVERLDGLDVIYCLTGESNLFIHDPYRLIPDKTTADLAPPRLERILGRLPLRLQRYLRDRLANIKPLLLRDKEQRRHQWSDVLAQVAQQTDRPLLIHTLPGETSRDAVTNHHLLAAVTVQTGHQAAMRAQLWQLPLALTHNGTPFINLESWYEGILDQFGVVDQLYAYWGSMLAGATSFCYGAHGIWNVGDGRFLSHWGRQTFGEAMALESPRLIGLSHQMYLRYRPQHPVIRYETRHGELIYLSQQGMNYSMIFFPEIARVNSIPRGRFWLPLQGMWVEQMPSRGMMVLLMDH